MDKASVVFASAGFCKANHIHETKLHFIPFSVAIPSHYLFQYNREHGKSDLACRSLFTVSATLCFSISSFRAQGSIADIPKRGRHLFAIRSS